MNSRRLFVFPFALLLLTACGEKSDSTPAAVPEQPFRYVREIDWVDSTGRWHPATDALGSTIDTTGGLFPTKGARVGFTITPKTTDVWPFVELIFSAPQPFSGTKQIQFTYRCDRELIVKLSQSDFGPAPEGNSTWSYYQIAVPASENWSTVMIPLSRLTLPDWADENSRKIALNLDHVQAVYFTPKLDALRGESSLLELRHLRIF